MQNNDQNNLTNSKKRTGWTLIPFGVFVVIYLGSGLIMEAQGVPMAFYQLPAPMAVVIGIISAFVFLKDSFSEKFDALVAGCGNPDVIIMCLIYLLTGGFTAVCRAMGSIDSTVNLGLTYIPPEYMAAGIFVITSFIATATGTSVGSCVAVGPIALGVAAKTGLSLPLVLGSVMGGCMLGDNLSIISDTTIASTRTQGCAMKDKFKLNLWLTVVPALLTVILLMIFGQEETVVQQVSHSFNLVKILPYIVVLITAVMGVNVFVVLVGGIIMAGAIGIWYGDFSCIEFLQVTYKGFLDMSEIFFLSMLLGGLGKMISAAGGIDYLLSLAHKFIKGRKTAELGIISLVSITDLAVANNTVAIIITGEVAKKICYTFKVDPRRSAGLLSTFSTIIQGVLPYGAQMLVLTGLAAGKVSPLEILPYSWFIYLLGISALISIHIPFSDGFIKRNPWNYALGKPELD